MTIRNLLLTVGIVGVVMFFTACSNKEDVPEVKGPAYDNSLPGEEGVKNAILGYNQAVMDAHLSDMHIKFIRKYATEKETKRVFTFINVDRERNLAMATKLNKLAIENTFVSDNEANVETSENWDFHYLDIKTSKPTEPVREMRYKLRYTLEKENGKWVIARLTETEKAMIGEYNPPRWSLDKGK